MLSLSKSWRKRTYFHFLRFIALCAHLCCCSCKFLNTHCILHPLLIVRYSGIGIWCAYNPLPSPTPTNPKPTNAEWEMRGLIIIALNGAFLGLWIFGFVCMLLSHDIGKCNEKRKGVQVTPSLTPSSQAGGSGGGSTTQFQNPYHSSTPRATFLPNSAGHQGPRARVS